MAIIDILQHYDAKKKAAHAAKTVKHGVCSSIRMYYLDGSVWKIMTNYRPSHCTYLSLCPSSGRSGDLHSEPRAVLQEVLRFHHHYLVIASRSNRGHRCTWEREGKWGVRWKTEVTGRKASRG